MDLLAYLDTHLLTRARVLAATGLDGAALAALQARRMVPQPSYRLRVRVQCTSFFGAHTEEEDREYYGTGTPAWIAAARTLENEDEACALFGRRLLARLRERDAAARLDAAAEWRAFLDGTYGLCTATGLPEEIADKEWAAATIGRLLEDVAAKAKPEAEVKTEVETEVETEDVTGESAAARRDALRRAVDVLDAASSPFAPHERQRSSRHRLVDAVRARFGWS